MDKDFADIILRMASEQGKEALVNGKAKMYLGDYCGGRFKKEANIFRQILDAGCGAHINNAKNVQERKQKLMQQLEEDNGLSPKVTGEYLDLLGLILKNDKSKSQTQVQATPAAPSAPTEGKQQGIFSRLGFGKKYEKEKAEKPHKKEVFSLPDKIDDSIETDSAAISSNGKYLAFKVSNEDKIQIMDTQSKKAVHSLDSNSVHEEVLGISSNGNFQVRGGFQQSSYLWDVKKEICYLGSNNHRGYRQLSFSPDSKRLAILTDGSTPNLEVLNTQNGNNLISITGNEYGLSSGGKIVYSPNGRYLAVAIDILFSKNMGLIFDARNGSALVMLEKANNSEYGAGAIAISHDGKRAVTLQEKVITIWDIQKGGMLLQIGLTKKQESGFFSFSLNNCDICFSPDDKTIFAGLTSGRIHIYSVETGELLREFQGDTKPIQWLSFTPNGKKLISYADSTVKFWVADK